MHAPVVGLVDGQPHDRIPASHRDLVECPRAAALTTLGRDGYPQTSVVWCDTEDEDGDAEGGVVVRVSTMRGFAKERNLRRDPRVTLLCFDPRAPLRYLEIRGNVTQMTEEGAADHLDALASKYTGHPARYFGDVVAADLGRQRDARALPHPADPRGGAGRQRAQSATSTLRRRTMTWAPGWSRRASPSRTRTSTC